MQYTRLDLELGSTISSFRAENRYTRVKYSHILIKLRNVHMYADVHIWHLVTDTLKQFATCAQILHFT